MEYLQALVLGLVQGITEFLPISSTAHLIIFTDMLGWKTLWTKPAIDAIQFGSVIAVIWYFRQDIRQILGGGWLAFRQKDWEREEWKILAGIAIGTVPVLIGGFFKKRLPESTQAILDGAIVIAIASIVMALLLGLAERIGTRKRRFSQLQIVDGLLVGLGQAVALIPGVSRSGATLTTALFLGLERQTAARFSFLLGIPALAIATLVQAKDAVGNSQLFMPLIVGIISAAIFSYIFIAWLLRYLQTQSTWVFVWYRLALGSCLLLSIALGQLK
ncbi:undecaprenyl-diphosphate phosphatase [Pseudanabaena sp. PCC 6802]|uniref:undecaprenyl-diphosphate phosphatase n=1 Tax=Pseudanabaena sp. PCC 6802 TaxID=118173 RepID=UPI00034887A9|nr:undecaprenyl-diphosphate phosphatase [Pseudanabaena sp. PCC 6802]